MKRWAFLLLLTAVFGCSKEKIPTLQGEWTIVESNAGTGYGFITTNYSPSSELKANFQADGRLLLSGPNPGQARSDLWRFNRFEILAGNNILLTNTGTRDTATAYYTLENGLSVWYGWATCGYEEKFVRTSSGKD